MQLAGAVTQASVAVPAATPCCWSHGLVLLVGAIVSSIPRDNMRATRQSVCRAEHQADASVCAVRQIIRRMHASSFIVISVRACQLISALQQTAQHERMVTNWSSLPYQWRRHQCWQHLLWLLLEPLVLAHRLGQVDGRGIMGVCNRGQRGDESKRSARTVEWLTNSSLRQSKQLTTRLRQ